MSETYDLIIIGAGPAGSAGSIYASRCFSLDTLVFDGSPGGQMAEARQLANYPGFKNISGWELMENMLEQAKSFGVEIKTKKVTTVREREGVFVVSTEEETYQAKTVLVAIGAGPRKLGVPGEEEFIGKGISYCALCDAPFYKDKVVGVVGGGDSALDGALELLEHVKKIFLIHRREEFRAKPLFVQKIKEAENVELVLKRNVVRVEGEEMVNKLILDMPYQGADFLKVDGVFIEIGNVPDREFLEDIGLETIEQGYVPVAEDMSTNIEGIYSAGDVTTASNGVKQIVTACSEGVIAAKSIYNYLRKEGR
ncbi:MAG: NAD(P)/FAD-dependent oxidoreductase [Patescibacteria group bacterium]